MRRREEKTNVCKLSRWSIQPTPVTRSIIQSIFIEMVVHQDLDQTTRAHVVHALQSVGAVCGQLHTHRLLYIYYIYISAASANPNDGFLTCGLALTLPCYTPACLVSVTWLRLGYTYMFSVSCSPALGMELYWCFGAVVWMFVRCRAHTATDTGKVHTPLHRRAQGAHKASPNAKAATKQPWSFVLSQH